MCLFVEIKNGFFLQKVITINKPERQSSEKIRHTKVSKKLKEELQFEKLQDGDKRFGYMSFSFVLALIVIGMVIVGH